VHRVSLASGAGLVDGRQLRRLGGVHRRERGVEIRQPPLRADLQDADALVLRRDKGFALCRKGSSHGADE